MNLVTANFLHAFGCFALIAAPAAAEMPPPDAGLTVSSPVDYEVFQRSSRTGGLIRVEGAWTPPKDAAERWTAEVRVGPSGAWQPLPLTPLARKFRAEVPAEAAPGWQAVEVRLKRGDTVKTVVDVGHVGVGEVFLIAGQSNSANYGEVRLKPQSGLVSSFDGTGWRIADDPQPGASGEKGSFVPPLGDLLVAALHVPIGFSDIGVGSTSVREWLPPAETFPTSPTKPTYTVALEHGGFSSDGALFATLAGRVRRFGPGGARALLWHQGESDWNQKPEHRVDADQYRGFLQTLIVSSRKAGGWDIPWIVAQASYHSPTDLGSEAFRGAQRAVSDGTLTFVGPNTDAIAPALREKNGIGVHFSEAGQKAHAQMWADVLIPWINVRLGAP